MKTYAMICDSRVIEVLPNCEKAPNWPPDPSGNPVTAVECDETIERGMIYDPETYTFSEYNPSAPEPTQMDRIEEKIDKITLGTVDQEYVNYYNEVNAALTGGV